MPKESSDIAIVGMALRFPGAQTVEQFWSNLVGGVESIRFFSDDELARAGATPESLRHPRYVKAGVVLEGFDAFDPEFFGMSPKEAAIMDPQHRHFLECAWEALETAGHSPDSFGGSIGVFAGCGMGAYFAQNLLPNKDLVDSVGVFLLRHTGNDKDFLATRASYCLNLRGPSVNVQTACSTSLVATHLACQSLLSGECDLALAGGVTIEIPHGHGYVYQPGEIMSPDGHCRAFDKRAEGTIFGSGVGVVVLRRLDEALRDGDVIHAVIKGSAVNNDGSGKVGYLAPGVDGQAAAAAEALSVAGVGADSIGYVECHGTGTKMGDPIEIAALTQAFRQSTERAGYCAIGSVKTNIGHLDTAAGVAGLIKASLSLERRKLLPTLHFEEPNPEIGFADSPFFVSSQFCDWEAGSEPRRACVNSLGVGGTNAHVVLEEPPAREPSDAPRRAYQLLVLSARNRSALDAASDRLSSYLSEHIDQNLADVAYTLAQGRRAFAERRVLAARDAEEAEHLLRAADPRRVFTHSSGAVSSVVFMFPGGGAQYPNMAKGLYQSEPVFREWVDRGLSIAKNHVEADLGSLLFPSDDALARAREALETPSLQLPALFIVEHALARLWMSLGIEPSALIGHSMGENTAACLSGVFRFEDALGLIALRGRLMDQVPEGGMLSIPLAASEVIPLLGSELDLASINGPRLAVVSGPRGALERLEKELLSREVEAKWVRIHIAAHSRMLEPILGKYEAYLRSIPLSPAKIPIVSNLTGTWLTPEQATDPLYWCSHLRQTVRFAAGIETLFGDENRAFLEVGPGKTLSSLARQHPQVASGRVVLSTLPHPDEQTPDAAFFLASLGRLWAAGLDVDLDVLHKGEKRNKVTLPTYPFQHQRYFIDPPKPTAMATPAEAGPSKLEKFDDWFYHPKWTAVRAAEAETSDRRTWLVFLDELGIGERVVVRLRSSGDDVVTVRPSDAYYQLSHNDYRLSPEHGRDGYDALVRDLAASGKMPDRVAHLWLLTKGSECRPGSSFFHRNQERGFYSLLFLAQAFADKGLPRPMHISVVANGMQRTGREPLVHPEKATVLGPCRVLPHELTGVTCASIDVALPGPSRLMLGSGQLRVDAIASALVAELSLAPANRTVALRGERRYEEVFAKAGLVKGEAPAVSVRPNGTYLITGGLGGIGLSIASHIASQAKVRLVLVTRSPSRGRVLQATKLLESRGAEVLVVQADVTDPEGMRRALDQARRRFGRLSGVVHAAGILADDLVQAKSQAAVEVVFAPKIYGTLVLDSLLAEEKLDFFVLCSSTSAFTGPVGQVDYVAANAFLNAYAQSRAHDRATRTVAIAWGVWNEVGMAAKAASSIGKPPSQDHSPAEPIAHHPLFDERLREPTGDVFIGRLGPRTHWVLDEHRTAKARAVLPGTAYLELARSALHELGEELPFEIRDLLFLRALAVADDRTREVHTVLTQTEQGYDLEVRSRDASASPDWEIHAEAKLLLGSIGPASRLDVGAIRERCRERVVRDPDGIASGQEKHLQFGPRFRVLQEARYGAGEALGLVELSPKLRGDLEDFALHPALVDIATGFAMDLVPGYLADTLYVPVSYRSVVVRASLPARFISWVRLRPAESSDFAGFDVVLADEEGNTLVEVRELMLRKLAPGQDLGQGAMAKAENRPKLAPVLREPSPAEVAFLRQLEQGILPEEGCRVFDRVLGASSDAVVVASSIELPWLLAHAGAPMRRDDKAATFARPQLATSYVEPRDDIERTLVGFWQELLGVERVGVEDNFFDLGGHSLVAVRLFAKIKSTYRVEYPISILFEAPTVERCAALLRAAVGQNATAPDTTDEAHRTRLTHLVSMHAPKGPTTKAPFFLVAGMFGNVLNLRHLAHLIGKERPFYGLQARGLYGDHTPHESFEAMAADYIAELRTVQPHGPYFLGGFSGGGITAFEMARQLMAAGDAVAVLVFLDTPLPFSPPLTSRDRWALHWQRLRKRGAAHLVDWMRERYAWQKKNAQPAAPSAKRPFDFHSEAIEAAFRRALAIYRLENTPLELTLFRPKLDQHVVLGPGRVINRERRFVYHDNGWGPYVEAVRVFEVPGDHDSMVLEPNVRVLASRLRECIENAEDASFKAARSSAARPDDAIVA